MSGAPQHYEGPALRREAQVRATSLDREARTVEVVMSTGALVRRRGWISEWDEGLPVDRARLERINTIGVMLDNHRAWGSVVDTLGSVVPGSVRVEGRDLVGRVRFARTERAEAVMDLIADGHLRAVSLGYDVDEFEEIKPKDRADGVQRTLLVPTAWEPYEVSVVQMPADAGAVVRSDETAQIRRYRVRSTEETTMPEPTTQTTAAPQTTQQPDAAAIARGAIERLTRYEQLGASLGIDPAVVRKLCADVHDDAAVNTRMLELAAQRQATQNVDRAVTSDAAVQRGADEADKAVQAITNGLAARMMPTRYGNKLTDAAERRASRMSLIDLARQSLVAAGVRGVDAMSKNEIASLALSNHVRAGGLSSTSDFPYLLANTQNKILLDLYVERRAPWQRFCRRMDRPDFKQFTMPQRSAAPSLQVVEESGIINRGAYGERTPETGKLKTAAITVAHTRQMIINDDLGAFNESTLGLASAAGRYEDDTVMALITGNPTMADTFTLFHGNHGNISASTGAPSVDTIHAAMLKMTAQTGLKGERLNLTPRFLLGAFREYLTAQQVLTPPPRLVAAASSNVAAQEALGLELLWDERLSDGSGVSDWYLIADPSQVAGIYYGGLEGDPSPRLSMDMEFSTDGVVRKLVHDFYGSLADHRWIVQTTD